MKKYVITFSLINANIFTNTFNGSDSDFLTFNYTERILEPIDVQTVTFILEDPSGNALSSDSLSAVNPNLFVSTGQFTLSLFDFDSTNIILDGIVSSSGVSNPVPEASTYMFLLFAFVILVFRNSCKNLSV